MIGLTVDGGKRWGAVPAARFDSPAALADMLAGCKARNWTERDGDDWVGASAARTLQRARSGDASRVALCDAMLARMEDAVGFQTRRWRTVDGVVGGVPNVPAYLAGAPLTMRRRVRQMDDAAPLTVALEMGVSQSVRAETLARRGAAALAFARIAAASRPVDLWVYFAARNGDDKPACMAVRLDTAPLDVARAAWLTCAPEALRRAGFGVLETVGGWQDHGTVRWLDSYEDHCRIAPELVRQMTGATDFVAVGGLVSNGDVDFATDRAAADWVRGMLATHGGVAAAA
jgi:hypothetical protein